MAETAHVLSTPLGEVLEMTGDELMAWHAEAIRIVKAQSGAE